MSAETAARIHTILAERLSPQQLEILDDSALHAGHAGARDGGGHYRVFIVSEGVVGCSRVRRRRMIYDGLGEMMKRDGHSLASRALAATEAHAQAN